MFTSSLTVYMCLCVFTVELGSREDIQQPRCNLEGCTEAQAAGNPHHKLLSNGFYCLCVCVCVCVFMSVCMSVCVCVSVFVCQFEGVHTCLPTETLDVIIKRIVQTQVCVCACFKACVVRSNYQYLWERCPVAPQNVQCLSRTS